MHFFSPRLWVFFALILLYSHDGTASHVQVPRDIQDLIDQEKRKGPLKRLQCSTPLGGKRPEVVQISFYPHGSITGPIQHAGVSPEEKEFNATTGRLEVVGRNLYTVVFDPAPVKPSIKTPSSSLTSVTLEERRALYWQQECAKLGLPPSEMPPFFNTNDDDSLDLSD